MPVILRSRTRSAIFSMIRSRETWYGMALTTMAVRPLRTSSISALARIFTEPRPVSRASRSPRLPTMRAPVGKSGPLTKRSRSSAVASGCSTM